MPVHSIGPSDSPSFDSTDHPGAASDPTVNRADPSASPVPGSAVGQLLQAKLSNSTAGLSRALKQATHQPVIAPSKPASTPGDASCAHRRPLSFGDQVEGFAHGAAQATGSMASGLWSMAKGAAALSPASYAAEKLSDATGLNAYHGFSSTAASAKQTVRTIAANPGGVLKAAVEPYRNAWQAGKYGEAIGMGTVDAVSMLADGVGEAGKVSEAASAAEKLAEGASAASKVERVTAGGAAETRLAAKTDASLTSDASRATERTAGSKPLTPGSNEALAPGAKTAAATRPANTTRHGVPRTNAADWRALRDHWDQLGYEDILSKPNREAIAKGRTPKVDDAWISVFPEDAGLKGERISMHHIGGSPVTIPLPATRHLDAHMPGGFRYNPGGPGSALPFYPPEPTGK